MTTYSVTIGPDDLPDGDYTVYVEAIDASSNANVTDTDPINITVTATRTPTVAPGRPEILVEIALGQAPFTPNPVWTDVTADVLYEQGINVVRGTTADNPTPTAGTLGYTFRDFTRKYDPTNSEGDYYGQLTPGCPTRVTGIYSSVATAIVTHDPISSHTQIVAGGTTTVPLGFGYIPKFPQSYNDPADKVTKVAIAAPDGLSYLARMSFMPALPATCATDEPDDLANIVQHTSISAHTKIVGHATWFDYELTDTGAVLADPIPDLPVEKSGWRILQSLLLAGIDSTYLAIDDGQTIVEGGFPQEKNLLDHIRTITATEYGRFYQLADGRLRFVERQSADRERQVSNATFSEATGTGVPYAGLTFDPQDDRFLVNRAVRGSQSVGDQVVQDQRSIDQVGTYEDPQKLAFWAVEDAADQATYVVGRQKDAQARVTSMVIKPDHPIYSIPRAMFPTVLNADVGWLFAVSRTPHRVGSEISSFVTLEQVTHQFDTVQWTTSFDLGEADTDPYGHADEGDLTDSGVLVAY